MGLLTVPSPVDAQRMLEDPREWPERRIARPARARAPGGERGFGLYRPREDPQGLQSKVLDSCCGVLLLGAEWFEVSLVVAAISLMSDSNGKEIDEGLLFWRRFIVDSHQVQVQDMLKDDLSQSTVMRRDPSHARARARVFGHPPNQESASWSGRGAQEAFGKPNDGGAG